ncbi:unnamed protein product [marine sediment metagenome]|uniref:Uncharacterized protein n=1 Tax=marine sediment metagenome TaxID=412755 RepID=X0XP29_9ZZZZ
MALTLWARLLLADLFIHGIGGAKYDRISDAIMADYYGVRPPHMACVSATFLMDLPTRAATAESVRRLRHGLRDLEYNPQRHLQPGPDLEPLIERRGQAVRRSIEVRESQPGNRTARSAAFRDIREISASMLALRQGVAKARRAELAQALRDLKENEITRGREYFFALHSRKRLERLTRALPGEEDFRV